MDCICRAQSGIDIVKIVVSDSTHRINVVHASINTKRCRIGWVEEYEEDIKKESIS